MPPHSFIKKDAGPIKEWWKSRIIMLIDSKNEEASEEIKDVPDDQKDKKTTNKGEV